MCRGLGSALLAWQDAAGEAAAAAAAAAATMNAGAGEGEGCCWGRPHPLAFSPAETGGGGGGGNGAGGGRGGGEGPALTGRAQAGGGGDGEGPAGRPAAAQSLGLVWGADGGLSFRVRELGRRPAFFGGAQVRARVKKGDGGGAEMVVVGVMWAAKGGAALLWAVRG